MDFSVWPASNRTWAEVADTAIAAERDGWHGLWFADHFMPNVAGTVDADDPVLEVWSVLDRSTKQFGSRCPMMSSAGSHNSSSFRTYLTR